MSSSGVLRIQFAVQIDGQEYDAYDGQTILETMMQNKIEHPHVCYHSNLGPIQTCDTCMVEV
ncbi:2Fe-2S iron-sulfur cluster-binding protein, partial [Alicyclobacillus tolerans]|uniref:2Fe-2S iron-sulfur cluster-binding protein n=1 Tax=Alicyclobacillus tolerans TaxID=90970 RepID=UPI001F31D521